MKAVINEKETPKYEYPCLKEFKGDGLHQLVLFKKEKSGTLIYQNPDNRQTGHHADEWPEYLFTPFTGSITLSND